MKLHEARRQRREVALLLDARGHMSDLLLNLEQLGNDGLQVNDVVLPGSGGLPGSDGLLELERHDRRRRA